MSKKRLSTEMQALAWQLQFAPIGVGGRAQHEALIERLGLNPSGDAGRKMTFGQLRHLAATAAVQRDLDLNPSNPDTERGAGDGVSVKSENGRGA